MKLHGREKEVIITIDANSYLLTVDSANKVLVIQYTGQTTLKDIRSDVDKFINELGFEPTNIVHRKVKTFKFN